MRSPYNIGPMTPQKLGLLSAAIPSPAGDVVGLLADAWGYAKEPESLTPAAGLLSLAGLLPGVPAGLDDKYKAARQAEEDAFLALDRLEKGKRGRKQLVETLHKAREDAAKVHALRYERNKKIVSDFLESIDGKGVRVDKAMTGSQYIHYPGSMNPIRIADHAPPHYRVAGGQTSQHDVVWNGMDEADLIGTLEKVKAAISNVR